MSSKRDHQRLHHSESWAGAFAMPEAFRDPEQFIAAFFNSAALGIAIVDPQLRFVAVNEALAEMNGISVKHHFGKTVRQILGNASGQIEPFFKQVLTTKEATPNVEITALLPTRRDAGRWLEMFFPIKNRAGKLRHIGAAVVEVPPSLSTSPDLSLSSSARISNWGDLLVKGESAATSAKPGIQLGSAILGGLTPETEEWIWKAAAVRECSRGEFFCLQGQQADKLFLLKRGCVKLCGTSESGKQVLLDWMLPGEVFGVGALLSTPIQYLWSVVAVEDSEAFSWGKADIARLRHFSPRTLENALQIALRWTAKLQERFEQLSDGFVEKRVAQLTLYLADKFKKNGVLEVSVSDAELAEMAGTNLYSVNKVLKTWQRHGYIQKSRKRLVILDRDKVKRLSLGYQTSRQTPDS